MNALMAESVVICGKQQLIDSAVQTLIVLCSCCVPGLVAWVLILPLQIHASSLILTGILKMTFRYELYHCSIPFFLSPSFYLKAQHAQNIHLLEWGIHKLRLDCTANHT